MNDFLHVLLLLAAVGLAPLAWRRVHPLAGLALPAIVLAPDPAAPWRLCFNVGRALTGGSLPVAVALLSTLAVVLALWLQPRQR